MTALLSQEKTRQQEWLAPAVCVLAAAVWALAVRPVDPGTLGSLGLAASISPAVLIGVAMLSVGFVLELRSASPRTWVLAGACMLAVICAYGLQPLVEPSARLPVAWLHAGWSGYIAQHGQILHNFDARFSWPAFFAFVAWLTKASGAPDATVFLAWAPPVFTGLAAIGVHTLASTVLGRGRGAWLAVWLFLIVNWVEQDYFSPQGLAYLMYLAALTIVLRWLCREGLTAASVLGSNRTRLAAAAFIVLLCAMAPEHQVTPFALAGLMVVLAVTRMLRTPWLAVVAVLIPLAWLALGAKEYWIGHLDDLFGGVGDLSGSVQQNVGQRFSGDLGRIAVLTVRCGLSIALLVLAAAGWWRLRKDRPIVLAVLALLPFGLVGLQSYGGEMLLRSYLYALPLLCTLGGAALVTMLDRLPTALLTAAGLGLAAIGLVTARGGNDAYVAFRSDDVKVVQEAYREALPGQHITALAGYLPMQWARVGEVRQLSLELKCPPGPDEAPCVRHLGPEFVIVNPAQDAYGHMLLGLPPGWSRAAVAGLESHGYREKLRIGDTVLLELGGTR
ncbi:hypothetical protein [Kutzneria buriramensis]|uniref:Glycosyltransferase RgtA/B/C/D-like domain-containing protein n=1 Tax=Kutzneria buriramensis TaxID=1045776 RepID=A0A3E0HCJ3_9PSEU|nr:hypothetical protein [Kutzneria buriramensis]REH42570.1 hypothetical protein BCF44_11065 [Kutzneria buriramensis]